MSLAAHLRRVTAAVVASGLAQLAHAEATGDPAAAHEHPASDFVLFLHGGAHRISGPPNRIGLNEDAALAADVVLAVTRDKFRLFGEYLVSSKEHDLERFQLGYEPVANTVVWIGRFHQPASAWNTEHHHGRYLQTSITRPSIELWEDEEGIVPQHLSGVLVESRQPLAGSAGLQFSVGAGIAPRVENEGLEPLDLLNMHTSGRRVSWSGRLAFLPDYAGGTGFGLLVAYHRLPVVDSEIAATLGASNVRQNIYGAYGDWREEPWRVLGAVYDIHVGLDGVGAGSREHFVAGYVQVERQLPRGFTVYGREENSNGASRSRYIAANHQSFDLRQATIGLRSDFRPRQALTLELARSTTFQGHQNEYRLQWSAVLP